VSVVLATTSLGLYFTAIKHCTVTNPFLNENSPSQRKTRVIFYKIANVVSNRIAPPSTVFLDNLPASIRP
jgi:hypothetical protein